MIVIVLDVAVEPGTHRRAPDPRLDELRQDLHAVARTKHRPVRVFLVEILGDVPALLHPVTVVDDHRAAIMETVGALPNPGKATGHDVDLESLVLERVLRRPDEGTDGGTGSDLQIEKRDGVVIGHEGLVAAIWRA